MMYAVCFEMAGKAWLDPLLVFDDAQAKLHKARLDPSKPVLVQIEGVEPTEDQLEQWRHLTDPVSGPGYEPSFGAQRSSQRRLRPGEHQKCSSSLLKNSKNEAFILWRVHCWDDVSESLRRFGGLDDGLAALQPVWECGPGYKRSD
jgi:hypothetical protein